MKRILTPKRFIALLSAVLLACLCFACGNTPVDPGPADPGAEIGPLFTLYDDEQSMRVVTQREGVAVALQKLEYEPVLGFLRHVADEWEETLEPGREYELPRVPTAGPPEYRLFARQGENIGEHIMTSGSIEVFEIEGKPWAPAPIDAYSPMIHLCRSAAIAQNEAYDYWYTVANAITTLRAVDLELPPDDEDSNYLVPKWLVDAYAAALFPGVDAPGPMIGHPWTNAEYDDYYVGLAYSTWLSAEYKDAKQNPDGIWDVTIKVTAPGEDWEWETVVKLAPNEGYDPDSPFEYHIVGLEAEAF